MKFFLRTSALALFVIAAACDQKKDNHDSHNHTGDSRNEPLYDEVMAVHDDVMPKMNDLHKAKTSLQTRLALPGTPQIERQEIKRKITRIDSASEGMMIWMRQFNPLPADSVGEHSARAYLQRELAKIKQVRKDILEALKAAGSAD